MYDYATTNPIFSTRIRLFVINCKNSLGDTTLVIAAKHANKKLVRLLMDHGADPTIRNKEGKNVEDYILELDVLFPVRVHARIRTITVIRFLHRLHHRR